MRPPPVEWHLRNTEHPHERVRATDTLRNANRSRPALHHNRRKSSWHPASGPPATRQRDERGRDNELGGDARRKQQAAEAWAEAHGNDALPRVHAYAAAVFGSSHDGRATLSHRPARPLPLRDDDVSRRIGRCERETQSVVDARHIYRVGLPAKVIARK